LEAWFDNNRPQFIGLEQRAFSHIYFSPGEHEDVESAARDALAGVNNANWTKIGDPFIEGNQVTLVDEAGLLRRYGPNFTKELFALPTNSNWQGPIASAFGMHLIRIDDMRSQTNPEFEQVRDDVIKVWQEQNLRLANEQRLVDLLEKYKVKVEGLDP